MSQKSNSYNPKKEEELHTQLIKLWNGLKSGAPDKKLKEKYLDVLHDYDLERQKQPLPF